MNKNARPHARLAAALGAALLLAASGAAASDRGMLLGMSCTACHGPGGQSPGSIPSIGGKGAEFIAARLREFRDGQREATVMNRLAKGYSDEEIDAIARYYAGLK